MTYPNALSKPRLRFCLRSTVNALLAFGLAHVLAVPFHGLWAVLPAVVMIQTSIGGSLKAAAEYTIGTIAGAVYAGAVAAVLPHATVPAFAGVLALAIGPLVYATAISPNFRAAPVTAVLVLMISAQLGEAPIQLAFYRSLEVAVGSAIVIAVSFLVFPARAHELGLIEASRVLEYLARVLPAVLAGFVSKRDPLENARLQDDVGEGVRAFAAVAREAKPERWVHLTLEPDPAVLARTLLRLRDDLVMMGRAAATPLPPAVAARLGPALMQIGTTASDYLLTSARALSARQASPPAESLASAIAAYLSEVTWISADGLMDGLADGDRDRIYALGFALHQLQENLSDLAACVHEWARNRQEIRRSPRQRDLKRVAVRLASMLLGFGSRLRRLCPDVLVRANRSPQLPAVASLPRWTGSLRSLGGIVLALLMLAAFARPAFAYDNRPSDPFDSHTIELSDGRLMAVWETLRDKVLDDKLRIEFCVEFGKESCPEVFKLMNIVAEARQNEGKALLGHLNRSINLAITPAPVSWTGPLQPMKLGEGDCKAYAIAKYVGALEAGIPIDHVRVVIVHSRRHHENHMVTAVYEKDEWLILDNLTMRLLRDSETRDYEPIAVLDHKGVRLYPAFW